MLSTIIIYTPGIISRKIRLILLTIHLTEILCARTHLEAQIVSLIQKTEILVFLFGLGSNCLLSCASLCYCNCLRA